MKRFVVPALILVISVTIRALEYWDVLDGLITKLRTKGSAGNFVADIVVSPITFLVFVAVAIAMIWNSIGAERERQQQETGSASNNRKESTDPVASVASSTVTPTISQISEAPIYEAPKYAGQTINIRIDNGPSFTHSQIQQKDRQVEIQRPTPIFECIRAKMIDVEVDMSSFEILLAPSNGRALDRCMAAIAEFRRNTDDSNIDSISIRTIAELKGRESESLSINEVRWLEHDLKTKRSATASFKRLDTKRLAVVLGISNRHVYTYEGRYVKESGGAAVFYVFRQEFQELTEAVYDVEIRLLGSQGGKVIVDNTFGFELIRGAELKDSIFRKKDPCLIVPGLQASKAKRIEQLSKFAEEGERLIIEYKEKLKADWATAKAWGGRAHTFISEHINDESAAYFSLETREHAYPGPAIDRIFVDWIYTRIQRIAEIASEVRKQQ